MVLVLQGFSENLKRQVSKFYLVSLLISEREFTVPVCILTHW